MSLWLSDTRPSEDNVFTQPGAGAAMSCLGATIPSRSSLPSLFSIMNPYQAQFLVRTERRGRGRSGRFCTDPSTAGFAPLRSPRTRALGETLVQNHLWSNLLFNRHFEPYLRLPRGDLDVPEGQAGPLPRVRHAAGGFSSALKNDQYIPGRETQNYTVHTESRRFQVVSKTKYHLLPRIGHVLPPNSSKQR